MIFRSINRTYEIVKPSIFESNLKYYGSTVGNRRYEITRNQNEIRIVRKCNSFIEFIWFYYLFLGVVAKGTIEESTHSLKLDLEFKNSLLFNIIIATFLLMIILFFLTSLYFKNKGLLIFAILYLLTLIVFLLFNKFFIMILCKNLSEDISSIQ